MFYRPRYGVTPPMSNCFFSHLIIRLVLVALLLAAGAAQAALTVTDSGLTITDDATGLVWKRCPEGMTWNGATCTGTASIHNWQAAFDQADATNAANFANHNDWRVPSLDELKSIVVTGQNPVAPTIDRTAFPNTPVPYFWSASPYAGNSTRAWLVDFNGGDDVWSVRSFAVHVRLVRAGQSSKLLMVSATAGDGGSVTPTPQSVGVGGAGHGGTARFTVTPESGYKIDTVSGCTDNAYAVRRDGDYIYVEGPTANCTVNVTFKAITVGLHVIVDGNGRVSASTPPEPSTGGISTCRSDGGNCEATYALTNPPATVTLIATPDPGWQFTGWNGDGCNAVAGTPTQATVAMDTERTCTARFAPISRHSITTTVVGPPNSGTLACDPNPVDHDQASTCTATPNPGYSVVQSVTGTGACGEDSNSATNIYGTGRIISDTCTVTATFALAPIGGGGQPIPTLSEWALILMSLLCGGILFWRRREE